MSDIECRFNVLGVWFEGIELYGYLIVLLAVSGLIVDALVRKRRQWKEVGANLVIAFGNSILALTLYGSVFIIALLFTETYAFFEIPLNVLTWFAAMILADFTYYWMHRWEHENRLLWAIHNVHHSSTEFDLTTGFRLSWFEGAVEWIFFVPMVLLGFDVVQVVLSISIVASYQAWIHTRYIGKLGVLDKIFNTPSVHRVHHGINPQYINKNFGGIFIVWDRLFGTYMPESELVYYGLTKQIGSVNPLVIHSHEFHSIFSDLKGVKTTGQWWQILMRRP